jgi:hypothetical protein
MDLPRIDWKTDGAGAIAAWSVWWALHLLYGTNPQSWTVIAIAAVFSGPFWAQLTVTLAALRAQAWRLFRLTPARVRDALIMAMLTPVGLVEGRPIPWIGFWAHEQRSVDIGVGELLVMVGVLIWVWIMVLAPIQRTEPKRARRILRMGILGVSMAFGVMPSFWYFFSLAGA